MVLAGASALIAVHGLVLSYVSSHMAASVTVLAGLIVIIVVKHLGLFGRLYAVLRKSRQP